MGHYKGCLFSGLSVLPSLPVYHNTGKVHCMLCSALWDKFKKERLKGVEKTRIKGGEGR